MKRERGPSGARGVPIAGSTEPLSRIGPAVLRGVPLTPEPYALRRPGAGPGVDAQRRPSRAPHPRPHVDESGERAATASAPVAAQAPDAAAPAAPVEESRPAAPPPAAREPVEEARLAGPGPGSFEEGRLAGYAEAEAAQRVAVEAAAQRGYQAGFDQGREEGRQQGLADGRDAGRKSIEREATAAHEQAAARLERLDALLSALPRELSERLASAEDDMIALCHSAVCRILGEQLVTAEGVAHSVRRAVREACGGSALGEAGLGPLSIRVHPRDLESLRADAGVAAWLDRSPGSSAGAIRWIADERVGPGGCVVSSPDGTLDARLEAQLSALRDVLVQGRSGGEAVPPAGGAPAPATTEPGP